MKIIKYTDGRYTTPCLVCEEEIELTEEEKELVDKGCVLDVKICDRCKNGILKVRQ